MVGTLGRMTPFPLSSGRERDAVRHETRRRRLAVIRKTELTDSLVRFTLGGDLADFTSHGPADHVKLFFPTPDGPAMRDYTPGSFRPEQSGGPELDIDFVIHGDSGPATAWASRAVVGSELELGGPRGSRLASSAFRNAVLVADGSAAAALRNWVRALTGVMPVSVIFYSDDARILDMLDADELASVDASVVPASADLVDAVGAHDIDHDTWVWAAGEATALIPLRRWLRSGKGLGAENLSLTGYWRTGVVALNHSEPLDPSDPD